ncbi:hypothetical protein GFD22_08225 [Bifidobacterium avesanii]|uniref:Uncharacterized protein n=1 Tax=Bifidobacterium avesanii TaxID=1798157 RepID=A0A7K3TIP6_9BIFI|nr:hypothetical protein [Bifidobacterium avesanii]
MAENANRSKNDIVANFYGNGKSTEDGDITTSPESVKPGSCAAVAGNHTEEPSPWEQGIHVGYAFSSVRPAKDFILCETTTYN